jgi:16S rRNA processing protein RimM
MKKEDAYYLGKIVKKHGIKGDLLAKIDTDEPELYENMESVFLDIKGKLVPYFLNKSTLHKSTTLRLDFEDINNIEEADALIGKELYLPLKNLPPLTGNKFYFHEVIGFKAVDEKGNEIGIIESINDRTPQAYFEIINDKKQEILIPVADKFIKKVDRQNKQIVFELPEAYLDVYTK